MSGVSFVLLTEWHQVLIDAVRALDDDALQLVESSIIPNLKAWGCVLAVTFVRFMCPSTRLMTLSLRLIPDD
jgi:hypothetical protein